MSERCAEIHRKTGETDVFVSIDLDGAGKSEIDTGIGFFDHMLTLFSSHGQFDLRVKCDGDIEVDGHHSVEDIGITMGQAFHSALGEKRGITRYGSFYLPMDETLVFVSLDISGRPFLVYDPGDTPMTPMIGAYDTELTEEFLRAFHGAGPCTEDCHRKRRATGGCRSIDQGASVRSSYDYDNKLRSGKFIQC